MVARRRPSSASHTEVFNSLFAGNGNGDLVTGVGTTPGDYNVTGDASAPGDHSKSFLDPMIGALGHYGGPTETAPPQPGSPALDAGSNPHLPPGIKTDQRGQPRLAGSRVDAGAVEVQ